MIASDEKSVFILITQCLQNGFFLADENRLCLPEDVVKLMLVGNQPKIPDMSVVGKANAENRREIQPEYLKQGPLYQFFEVLTGASAPPRTAPLHIVHLRDWHAPSPEYDIERRLYGSHCEAGTWEAEPIDGFEPFLSPWKTAGDKEQALRSARSINGYRTTDNIHYYDVRSDSVFDFKTPASLELQKHLADIKQAAPDNPRVQVATSHLQIVLDHLIEPDAQPSKRIYVVVIGAYTDIKIKILLTGLRTRYAIDGLFVSDILTSAPTLERHVSALDFADKVLTVQVVHSLNEVVSILNPGATKIIEDDLTATTFNFRSYASHFLDRQNLLAFQDQRLLKYLELTSNRSSQVYSQIYNANWYLMRIGYFFLALTIVVIVLRIVGLNIPNDIIWATAGLSLGQILISFFAVPAAQMQNNINTLVRLRNYLETYSNVTGLLRHHLTTIERLQPNLADPDFKKKADAELELLQKQLDIIHTSAAKMSETFHDLAPDSKKPVTPDEDKPSNP